MVVHVFSQWLANCAKTKFKEDVVPAALNAVNYINISEDPFANFNFNTIDIVIGSLCCVPWKEDIKQMNLAPRFNPES